MRQNRAKQFFINFRYGFNWRKPIFLLRTVVSYFRVFVLRQRVLRSVDISIGYRCNFRCRHCFNTSLRMRENRDTRLTLDEISRIARECRGLGAIGFGIQGGEPLIYEDLEDIIKALKPRRSFVYITTNAFYLTKEKMLSLRRAGVDFFVISIDSGDRDEHDSFRGVPGAYDRAQAALRTAVGLKINVTINATVTSKNLRSDGLLKLIRLADELRVNMNLIMGAPVGGYHGNSEALLSEEDIAYYHELRRKYFYLRRDMDANYIRWGCGAATEMLYISPDGNVFICPFMHITFGNIREDSIKVIQERALAQKIFANYHKKCFMSEDRNFIKEYLSLMDKKKEWPVSWKESDSLFNYKRG